MGCVYHYMLQHKQNVDWYKLLEGNIARPHTIFCLWMLCHKRLATKDSLNKFGLVLDRNCCFGQEYESNEHLFFWV